MKSFLESWRPQPWILLLALGGIAVCTRLSFWQWDRGTQKANIEESRLQASLSEARQLATLDVDALPIGERVSLQGRWLNKRTILQDNQTRKGRPGVHVWTPFELRSGQSLMVDRGWLELPADRSRDVQLPKMTANDARGLLRELPKAAIATRNACEPHTLPRLNYPDVEDLRCALGLEVVPALLLLDADVDDAFIREWQRFEMPPAKHYAYAFQWAALAVTILILLLRFNRIQPSTANNAKH